MSNENKTALTAEEYLKSNKAISKDNNISGEDWHYVIELMNCFASLQTQEKDKLIEQISIENGEMRDNLLMSKMSIQDKNDTIESLQSTIESQQKEIAELNKIWNINTEYILTLESQLSEVTKERDKYKQAFFYTKQKF